MANNVIKYVRIETDTREAMLSIRDKIHNQLIGNKDYIDNNIVLSDDESRGSNSNVVEFIVFEECSNVPEIII